MKTSMMVLALFLAVGCTKPEQKASPRAPAGGAPVSPANGGNGGNDDENTDVPEKVDVGTLGNEAEGEESTETPSADGCYKADAQTCGIEKEIHRLMNELRAQSGRQPIKFSQQLGFVARDFSQKLAQRGGSISHEGFPNARDQVFRAEFPDGRSQIRGENVALGPVQNAAGVARQLFTMWKNSPGHRANMVGNFGTVGIGIAQGARGWYGTQIFGETGE